jgi:hypothetical protein
MALDPNSVITLLEDRRGSLAWMYVHDPDAYLAEMDRRIVGRLREILNVDFGDVRAGKSARARRLAECVSSTTGDPLEHADWMLACPGRFRHFNHPEPGFLGGRCTYYDEIQPDDDGARLEYLKSLVKDETPPEPPRRCPLPRRLERKGRDSERKGRRWRGR